MFPVAPVQPLAVGVTVTVAVTGAVPVFTPLKAAMFPLPEAAKPMRRIAIRPSIGGARYASAKVMAVTEAPLQTVWSVTLFTVGVGFTVMVNVSAGPGNRWPWASPLPWPSPVPCPYSRPLNAAMFPLPEAGRPIVASLFVQA